MAMMTFGVFSDRVDAEAAVNDLERQGFDRRQISLVMRDVMENREMTNWMGSHVFGGAASGATTGGIIGGLAGLLIGVGAITIPGLGVLLIGGPLAAALGLTGAAATAATGALTGALAGGLVGALVGLGVPEETARMYMKMGLGQGVCSWR